MNPLTLIAIVRHGYHVIGKQQKLIRDLVNEIERLEREKNSLILESAREVQGMMCGWLLNLEQPELDVRDELIAAEADLGLKIAILEEHVL